MSFRKEYRSLSKSRAGGVAPQNRLTAAVHKISIPTENTVSSGALYVVKPLSIDDKKRSHEVQTCFHITVVLQEAGLAEPPLFSVRLRRAEYNGTAIAMDPSGDLVLSVSHDGRYIFFKKGVSFIDKLVLPESLAVRSACFADDYSGVLLVIQQNFGYVNVSFCENSHRLYDFLKQHGPKWGSEPVAVSSATLESRYAHEAAKRENLTRDPQTVISVDNSQDDPPAEVLRDGLYSHPLRLPKKPVYSRKTRSVSQLARENPDGSPSAASDAVFSYAEKSDPETDEPIVRETPAPFDPPLRYSVAGEKKFSIAYNDFKTLYNNDWINDTLIDFFIAYEIDRAVTVLQSVHKEEVYAFNSFFFTKLLSKSEDVSVPDYYGNIRRWVMKTDLMKHDSVIIPINEHLHWYCVIIRNLPKLLQMAQQEDEPESDGAEQKKRCVDVYVVDSLRQNHSDIAFPLKTVIKEYCREKHGVEINSALIRITNAPVSRQRNFNDCGIHVIYNIRKWLGNPAMCEAIWRKPAKLRNSYFSGSERSGMRKECIDLLLDLHSKQPADTSEKSSEDNASDDEIELISYHTSKVNEEEAKSEATNPEESKSEGSTQVLGSEYKQSSSEKSDEPDTKIHSAKSSESATPSGDSQISEKSASGSEETRDVTASDAPSDSESQYRTLDPRANGEPVNVLSGRGSLLVDHPQVRKLCLRLRPQQHTKEFLNSFFVDHDKRYKADKQLIIAAFVEQYNAMKSDTQSDDIRQLEEKFKENFKEPKAPMYESFVIEEADDSGGELNRSVNDLRISSASSRPKSQANSTPEATRVFLRQADASSPIEHSSPVNSVKPTRSKTRSFFEGNESDLEIVDDAFEILPGKPNKETTLHANVKAAPKHANPSQGHVDAAASKKKPSSREIVTIPDDDAKGRFSSPKAAAREWSYPKRRKVD